MNPGTGLVWPLQVHELPVPGAGMLDLDVASGDRVVLTGADGDTASAVLAALAGRTATPPGVVTRGASGWPETGYVRADRTLVGTLTAVENLAVVLLAPHRATRSQTSTAWTRAEEVLESVGIGPASWHNLVEQLSGGQQQRVALARAIVGHPPVLVLDEPTSELDADSALRIRDVLQGAVDDGAACVLASRDRVLLDWCDRSVSLVRPD